MSKDEEKRDEAPAQPHPEEVAHALAYFRSTTNRHDLVDILASALHSVIHHALPPVVGDVLNDQIDKARETDKKPAKPELKK
jgi:hypothetical protein